MYIHYYTLLTFTHWLFAGCLWHRLENINMIDCQDFILLCTAFLFVEPVLLYLYILHHLPITSLWSSPWLDHRWCGLGMILFIVILCLRSHTHYYCIYTMLSVVESQRLCVCCRSGFYTHHKNHVCLLCPHPTRHWTMHVSCYNVVITWFVC